MPPWVSRFLIQGRMNARPAYPIGAHKCAPYISRRGGIHAALGQPVPHPEAHKCAPCSVYLSLKGEIRHRNLLAVDHYRHKPFWLTRIHLLRFQLA